MNLLYEQSLSEQPETNWYKNGSFIWHEDHATYFDHPKNQICLFRKTFNINHSVKQARLRIIAETKYKLYINGSFIGRGPSRYDPRWAYFDEYDLTDVIQFGENVIAVL